MIMKAFFDVTIKLFISPVGEKLIFCRRKIGPSTTILENRILKNSFRMYFFSNDRVIAQQIDTTIHFDRLNEESNYTDLSEEIPVLQF